MSGARRYDLIVVGGGMVGASLAIALAGRGLRIALIEAHALGGDTPPCYDDRAIALAYGTRRIFEAIDVWPALQRHAAPIRPCLQRSQRGGAFLEVQQRAFPALFGRDPHQHARALRPHRQPLCAHHALDRALVEARAEEAGAAVGAVDGAIAVLLRQRRCRVEQRARRRQRRDAGIAADPHQHLAEHLGQGFVAGVAAFVRDLGFGREQVDRGGKSGREQADQQDERDAQAWV